MPPPTLADILRARRDLQNHLAPTPLVPSPALSRLAGCEIFLKLECLAPVGSFKARGVIARLARLSSDEAAHGVITASTGNHGAALAWAARRLGLPATVVLPEGVPEIKRQSIADAGAAIVQAGRDWNESCLTAKALAAQSGALYLEDGSDPIIMAGAATVAFDVLEELPEAEVLVVPVGGGNLIAGCGLVARALRPDLTLVGVQSEAAPGAFLSWQRRELVLADCQTAAGGIATRGPLEMAFEVMRRTVDEMVLVSEAEWLRAVGLLARHLALIVEGAGAAPLAAVLRYRDVFLGRRVVLVISGRNLEVPTLARALTTLEPSP